MKSKSQDRVKKYFKKNEKKIIVPVNDDKLQQLYDEYFFTFLPKHEYTVDLEEAKELNKRYYYKWQEEISKNYIRSVFKKISMDLTISVDRQRGKTEAVSLTTAFLLEKHYEVFMCPLNIAVFAPVKQQANILFKRATEFIDQSLLSETDNTKEKKMSIKGDEITLFGIYDETKGSTTEGYTFDIIIRDEAHKGNDQKFIDETEPTRFTKSAIVIRIGNGGFKDCDYLRSIREGSKVYDDGTESVLVRYTYAKTRDYLVALNKIGYAPAGTLVKETDRYIKKYGLSSKYVRKNIFCEWKTDIENAVTSRQIEQCCTDYVEFKKDDHLFLSFDVATSHDRSVATIMNTKREVVDWIIVKEKGETARIREQCAYLKDECDKRGYTNSILAIGFDATGVGSGGVIELMEDYFFCDMLEYRFTASKKHEWVQQSIDAIATEYKENRVKLPKNHPLFEIFKKEWIELERHEVANQKYSQYYAPKREECYDDFVMSFCICMDVVIKNQDSFFNLPQKQSPSPQVDLTPTSPLAPYTHYLQKPQISFRA